MKLSEISSNIAEAFKAGNRARKKESVQDTVDSVTAADFKEAIHTWCNRISDAMYERNTRYDVLYHCTIPSNYLPSTFYSAETILSDLEDSGVFEPDSDRHIELEDGEFKGSVWISICKSKAVPDGIDIVFDYERTDRDWWDEPGSLSCKLTLTIGDLMSNKGVSKFFNRIEKCYDKMIG